MREWLGKGFNWLAAKVNSGVSYCGSFLNPTDKSTDMILLAMAFGISVTSLLLVCDFRINHHLDKICYPAFTAMIAAIHIFKKGQD